MNGTIKQKLSLIVGMFILAIVMVSAGLLHFIDKGNDFSEQLVIDHLEPTEILGTIHTLVHDNRAEVMLAIQHDPTNSTAAIHKHGVEQHFEKIAANKIKIDQAFEAYQKHTFATGEEEAFQKLKEARDEFVNNGLLKVVIQIKEGNYDEGLNILLKDLQPRIIKTFEAMDELSVLLKKQTDREIKEQRVVYKTTMYTVVLLVSLVCVTVVIISHVVAQTIIRPMHEAVVAAKSIASGDLSVNISSRATNETGQLLGALGEMVDSLRKIVENVRSGSESIAVATHQIASGNHDLAVRTEQQVSHLGETAESIREFSLAVGVNAQNAATANARIRDASNIASEAGMHVTEVISTMRSIDESSLKIVDIISVIDSIAFQTNILALNAAVEAARAGKHGLGFAVVATEVRALAQRSANAAKEIKALINSSVERVERGIALVDRTGATMIQMVASVEQTSGIIADISRACAEQKNSIDQVNKTLTDMDSMTQQNAALVEEAAAASGSLDSQTQSLKSVVSVFRLHKA